MGLKSLGSCPPCPARNSKPAFRRASRGNCRRSLCDEPIQAMGLSRMPNMPDEVYQIFLFSSKLCGGETNAMDSICVVYRCNAEGHERSEHPLGRHLALRRTLAQSAPSHVRRVFYAAVRAPTLAERLFSSSFKQSERMVSSSW